MKFLSKIFMKSNKANFVSYGKGSLVSKNQNLYILCSTTNSGININEISQKIMDKFYEKYSKDNIKGNLRESLQEVNEEINNKKINNKKIIEISFVCFYKSEKELIIAHAGITNLYVYSFGELKQITEEDTDAYQLFKMGIINYERLKSHPFNDKLSNALGKNKILIPNMHEYFFNKDDKIIIGDREFFENFSLIELEEILNTREEIDIKGERLKAKIINKDCNFILKNC